MQGLPSRMFHDPESGLGSAETHYPFMMSSTQVCVDFGRDSVMHNIADPSMTYHIANRNYLYSVVITRFLLRLKPQKETLS